MVISVSCFQRIGNFSTTLVPHKISLLEVFSLSNTPANPHTHTHLLLQTKTLTNPHTRITTHTHISSFKQTRSLKQTCHGRKRLDLRHNQNALRIGHIPLQIALRLTLPARPHFIFQQTQQRAQLLVRQMLVLQIQSGVNHTERNLCAPKHVQNRPQQAALHQNLQRNHSELRPKRSLRPTKRFRLISMRS